MFYQSRRNLSEAERKTNKWAVIMTSAVTGDIIVPDIRLLPLRRISYFDIARKVLAANPKKKLQKHEIEDLWDGIMRTVYDFEAKLWNQKKNDVMFSMVIIRHRLLTTTCVYSFCRRWNIASFKKRQRSQESVSVGRSAIHLTTLMSKFHQQQPR